jgi:sphI restriction endonuclease
MTNLPKEFLDLLEKVTAKRAKTVINHILQYGQITTEDLKEVYGYSHPPRAIRDVREQGIPLDKFNVKDKNGRSIAAYRFGNPNNVRSTQLSGRTAFTTSLKKGLIERYGAKCHISLIALPEKDLQIDHRVPFEIAGDNPNSQNFDDYMLLSASSNRLKSWNCEHCPNWQKKEIAVCLDCYWAYPESYHHVATQQIRRLDVEWLGEEAEQFDKLAKQAEDNKKSVPDFVKKILKNSLDS